MKFAHFADCHLGGWRDQALRSLGMQSFAAAVDRCIAEHTAFVVIAGDLFDTALPDLLVLQETARYLQKLRDHDISVYVIPGGHDYSPSGKTMLQVLEEAGLLTNVARIQDDKPQFTTDKTGTLLTGVMGLKGSLDTSLYKQLQWSHLQVPGFKIFLFHCAIKEITPREMQPHDSVHNFPDFFNYYAGGHVHEVSQMPYGKGIVAYPGPVFPNNFAELEKLRHGGFHLVDDSLRVQHIPLPLREVVVYHILVDGKTPQEVTNDILSLSRFQDKIVLLRIEGVLARGRISDIDFQVIESRFRRAYAFLRNTTKIQVKQQKASVGSVQTIEDTLIKKFQEAEKEVVPLKRLLRRLDDEKAEGETFHDFEHRLIYNLVEELKLQHCWG